MKTGKFKGFLKKAGIGSLVAIALIGLAKRTEAYFKLSYSPNPMSYIIFYSQNSEIDPNDDVGVFVNSNNPNIGKICVGVREDNLSSGNYGPLDVYGNDTTTAEKDGADHNDLLEFRIWKASEMKEYFAITPSQVIFDSNNLWSYVEVDLLKGNRVPYTLRDLSDFVSWWLEDCDDINNNCAWWDINKDGIINFIDYVDFANNYGGS